jgi:ribosomal protein S8E
MSAVGGAIAFIEGLLETGEMKPSDVGAPGFGPITISGGNVTFGDGSHINITTVTAGDLLRALQAHVEATVADPATKESVLAQIGSVLKHPASTAVLQVALPELLKRLFGA